MFCGGMVLFGMRTWEQFRQAPHKEKSVRFEKERFHFFCNCQRGRGVLTPDPPCVSHWGQSLSAWVTQKRRSGSEPLVTLPIWPSRESNPRPSAPITCALNNWANDRYGPKNRTQNLPHRCLKPLRQLVGLAQNYDIASGLSACTASILFQEYLQRWNVVLFSHSRWKQCLYDITTRLQL